MKELMTLVIVVAISYVGIDYVADAQETMLADATTTIVQAK